MTDITKRLELKTKRRDKKKKPKMAVHGKRIFQVIKLSSKMKK